MFVFVYDNAFAHLRFLATSSVTNYLMLWSQIKLTSHDSSDLHITGEFDNRPGTGRFLRCSSCVVTYRTGASLRLYMKTSADARPRTVRHCKRSAGHRTVPGRFFTCNDENIYIKIRHHSSKNNNRLLK